MSACIKRFCPQGHVTYTLHQLPQCIASPYLTSVTCELLSKPNICKHQDFNLSKVWSFPTNDESWCAQKNAGFFLAELGPHNFQHFSIFPIQPVWNNLRFFLLFEFPVKHLCWIPESYVSFLGCLIQPKNWAQRRKTCKTYLLLNFDFRDSFPWKKVGKKPQSEPGCLSREAVAYTFVTTSTLLRFMQMAMW